MLIPSLFGLESPLEDLRNVLSLNASEGGIGIQNLIEEAPIQHQASLQVTKPHVESIIAQDKILRERCLSGQTQDELKITAKNKNNLLKKQKN